MWFYRRLFRIPWTKENVKRKSTSAENQESQLKFFSPITWKEGLEKLIFTRNIDRKIDRWRHQSICLSLCEWMLERGWSLSNSKKTVKSHTRVEESFGGSWLPMSWSDVAGRRSLVFIFFYPSTISNILIFLSNFSLSFTLSFSSYSFFWKILLCCSAYSIFSLRFSGYKIFAWFNEPKIGFKIKPMNRIFHCKFF